MLVPDLQIPVDLRAYRWHTYTLTKSESTAYRVFHPEVQRELHDWLQSGLADEDVVIGGIERVVTQRLGRGLRDDMYLAAATLP